MPNILRLMVIVAIFFSIGFVAIGCEKKGPAEKAGEKIDQAVEDAGDQIEEAGDAVEEATE